MGRVPCATPGAGAAQARITVKSKLITRKREGNRSGHGSIVESVWASTCQPTHSVRYRVGLIHLHPLQALDLLMQDEVDHRAQVVG